MNPDFSTFIEIHLGVMLGFRDTGFMSRYGFEYFDTPYEFVGIANTNFVPYIVYNEEGTRFTQKNKGFISQKIVGQINEYAWSLQLGLPFDNTERNDVILRNQNVLLQELGAVQDV